MGPQDRTKPGFEQKGNQDGIVPDATPSASQSALKLE
jgi:hypothetical protein